jgi:hypothetical protein
MSKNALMAALAAAAMRSRLEPEDLESVDRTRAELEKFIDEHPDLKTPTLKAMAKALHARMGEAMNAFYGEAANIGVDVDDLIAITPIAIDALKITERRAKETLAAADARHAKRKAEQVAEAAKAAQGNGKTGVGERVRFN